MSGLMDRLAAAKSKQEDVEKTKAEEEKALAEKEAQKGELVAERENVTAELANTESAAQEAESALAEIAQMESGDLDPSVKEEIEAIKSEAAEKLTEFESLKAQLAELDKELETFETGEEVEEEVAEAQVEEASTEEVIGVQAEKQEEEEAPFDLEKTKAEAQELSLELSKLNKETSSYLEQKNIASEDIPKAKELLIQLSDTQDQLYRVISNWRDEIKESDKKMATGLGTKLSRVVNKLSKNRNLLGAKIHASSEDGEQFPQGALANAGNIEQITTLLSSDAETAIDKLKRLQAIDKYFVGETVGDKTANEYLGQVIDELSNDPEIKRVREHRASSSYKDEINKLFRTLERLRSKTQE